MKHSILFLFIFYALHTTAWSAIIYSNPDDITVHHWGIDSVWIDIDGNGVDDFNFRSNMGEFYVAPRTQNLAALKGPPPSDLGDSDSLYAFNYGDIIKTSDQADYHWSNRYAGIVSYMNVGGIGEYQNKTAYGGFAFDIEGNTHYAWVQIRGRDRQNAGDILDWAYEDIPNKAIVAGSIPEPQTYALIMGLITLVIVWRKPN